MTCAFGISLLPCGMDSGGFFVKGIDLVFTHRNGETWVVEAKCYAHPIL